MQRRAAAVYVALFLVIGAASYSLIATASTPTISFENPEHTLSEGDEFSVGDQQYTVSSLTAEESGGGHGGGTSVTHTGEITWTEDAARHTETWEHNDTVTIQDDEYRVLIADGEDPTSFQLQEEINQTAALQEDSSVGSEVVTVDGEDYVVRQDGDDRTLIPASEYFPEPATAQYSEGDTFDYGGNETTVDSVTGEGATVAWTAPETRTREVGNAANVTLNDQTYFAYFPDEGTLVLEEDYDEYERQNRQIDEYEDQVNGLWGVSIVSFATAILLLGMAYMPSRY